jgi:ATP-dependent Zn protease
MSGHDPLESAMFWVGALLALLPVVLLFGVLLYVWRQRRRAGRGDSTGVDTTNG